MGWTCRMYSVSTLHCGQCAAASTANEQLKSLSLLDRGLMCDLMTPDLIDQISISDLIQGLANHEDGQCPARMQHWQWRVGFGRCRMCRKIDVCQQLCTQDYDREAVVNNFIFSCHVISVDIASTLQI